MAGKKLAKVERLRPNTQGSSAAGGGTQPPNEHKSDGNEE